MAEFQFKIELDTIPTESFVKGALYYGFSVKFEHEGGWSNDMWMTIGGEADAIHQFVKNHRYLKPFNHVPDDLTLFKHIYGVE